jgi:hypothetical protein
LWLPNAREAFAHIFCGQAVRTTCGQTSTRLAAQACQEVWRIFRQKYFQIFTGENFTTPDYEGISEALPTTSVGKLCVQPVDKRLHALWHKRVNKIGEKITKNICMADWRKIHQSY